ncbi:hypothetical protein [Floccifex sp.]|uniref:hypothetical protein n=1 Tax=Floccifex sp. TaxID=2815810 RepID=UPI003F088F7E
MKKIKNGILKNANRLRFKKSFVLLACALFLLVGVVDGTAAFLMTKTDNVQNNFEYGNVATRVQEDFDDNGLVKSNVSIQNTGNISAYIRATVVVTWQDYEGNVLSDIPKEGTDYTIIYTAQGWKQGTDGYWYYQTAVPASKYTGQLISGCNRGATKAPVDGYTLHVEILADAIQAEPADAVKEAWPNGPLGGK